MQREFSLAKGIILHIEGIRKDPPIKPDQVLSYSESGIERVTITKVLLNEFETTKEDAKTVKQYLKRYPKKRDANEYWIPIGRFGFVTLDNNFMYIVSQYLVYQYVFVEVVDDIPGVEDAIVKIGLVFKFVFKKIK